MFAGSRPRSCLQRTVLTFTLALAMLLPVNAARPLLDQHQWDRDFALFARDSSLPWRPAQVRLNTYSSAPVDLTAYAVDPTDVIVVGRPRGRAVDVSHRRPDAHWRFSPPLGYRVEGNTVTVPLGQREGVFVIQARRGQAVQQVWINRSRIGLLAKSAPQGLLIYGADLASGKPLGRMRLSFLVGGRLETHLTTADGTFLWNGAQRPRFVLAQWGKSWAFLTLLPQAPIPNALAAIRVDRAVVRSGGTLRIAGYARRLTGGAYRRATGNARIALLQSGRALSATTVPLDSAGAFTIDLHVPIDAAAGPSTVLVVAGGASAGTGVTINAAADVALSLTPTCSAGCLADHALPLLVTAMRQGAPAGNVPIHVVAVRYPHILVPGTSQRDQEDWGATTVLDTMVMTNPSGRLRVSVPAPSDGLPSTLGIRATTRNQSASVSTRVTLAQSRAAIAVLPLRSEFDIGQPVAVDLRGFDANDGKPLTGLVTLRIEHGPNSSATQIKLDAHGRGHVAFHQPQLGNNLLLATFHSALGDARDANAVTVEPRALGGSEVASFPLALNTDRSRYRPGAKVILESRVPGAHGSALISIDALHPTQMRVVPVGQGHVRGALMLRNAEGNVCAAMALVRHGALVYGSTPLAIDGPGHERLIDLKPQHPSFAPGELAQVQIHDGGFNMPATTIVRLADGASSDGAFFETAGDVLATGGVTTQTSAGDDPAWHAWVTPQRSSARDLFADLGRRAPVTQAPPLDVASPRILHWSVSRGGNVVAIPLPQTPGRYVLSVMRIYDDGDVGASSTTLLVS